MASDDLTRNLPQDEDKTTQPTLKAVFELVREVKDGQDHLITVVTQLSARLDAVESRLARDISGLGYKIEA